MFREDLLMHLMQGFPDVSANGANLMGYLNGTLTPYYGTSLSAPLFASVLTLVRPQRAAKGWLQKS